MVTTKKRALATARIMKRDEYTKKTEDRLLFFGTGLVFGSGLVNSMFGFLIPAVLLGIAVVVTVSLVRSRNKNINQTF